ncbi:putative PurR-regulated permease PerM [Kitasatospora sp. MAP12-15]|uniref:AI-2E family transporter n=1 Tax=unclassified Kitasatospora TaxID=2633591 RepID=UPI0024735CC6|nr:AI-2E family transporter [Kitasatospora sp. MAP12-44]MDH6114732.1 putative PurR-regulated permease PerM [Kitasatospora sp. MAP12-44]
MSAQPTPEGSAGGPGEDRRRPYEWLPPPVRGAAAWSVVVILFITVAGLVVYAFVALRAATIPLLVALLGTALLQPVMPWLVRRGLGRGAAAGLTCAVLVTVVCGVLALLTNSLVHSAPQIAESLKQAGDQLADWLGPVGAKLQHALAQSADYGNSAAGSLAGSLASGVLSGLGIAVQLVTGAVLSLALVFLFLRDGHRSGDLVRSTLPAGPAETIVACGQRAFGAMAGYMRGTTLIALIDATFITVGLVILGVPGAAGLGALVFLGAFIPFVGAFLSGTVAVLVALADGGLSKALWTLGMVLAVQLIEGNVLQPMIQSRTVELHPATIMIAVVAGAGVAGIIGALLAVPLCAAALGILSVLRGRPLRTPARSHP